MTQQTRDLRALKDEAAAVAARGDARGALALYAQVAAMEPDDPRWLQRLAECHRALGDVVTAARAFRNAAAAYAREGFELKAVAAARVALQLLPGDAETRRLLDSLVPPAISPRGAGAGASLRPDAGAPEVSIDEGRITLESIDLTAKLKSVSPEKAGRGVAELDIGTAREPDVGYEDLTLDESVFEAPEPPSRVSLQFPAAGRPAARQAVPPPAPDALDASDDLFAQGGDRGAAAQPSPAAPPLTSERPPAVDPSRLRGIPLLGPLPPEGLDWFVRRVEYQTAAPGDRVIAEGDTADSVYFVVSGDLVATRGNPPRPVARLGEGSFFGEMALLDDTPRSASVVAVTDVELIKMRRKVVMDLCDRHPSVLASMMQSLRTRLIATLTNTSPLFAPIPPGERAPIVARFRLVEIETGTTIIREGQRADGLYVFLTGRADVSTGGGDVASLTTGDVAGEMSLLSGGSARATVRARTRVTALVLPAQELQEIIMVHPAVLEHLATLSDARKSVLDEQRSVRRV